MSYWFLFKGILRCVKYLLIDTAKVRLMQVPTLTSSLGKRLNIERGLLFNSCNLRILLEHDIHGLWLVVILLYVALCHHVIDEMV